MPPEHHHGVESCVGFGVVVVFVSNQRKESEVLLSNLIGEYGLVCKIDVADVEASIEWYKGKLKLVPDERFHTPGWWAQLYLPEFGPHVAVGLNKDASGVGTGGARLTFVVDNIKQAKAELEREDVTVGEIQTLPHDVQLAYFSDLDGNNLGLRQNGKGHPTASAIAREGREWTPPTS